MRTKETVHMQWHSIERGLGAQGQRPEAEQVGLGGWQVTENHDKDIL